MGIANDKQPRFGGTSGGPALDRAPKKCRSGCADFAPPTGRFIGGIRKQITSLSDISDPSDSTSPASVTRRSAVPPQNLADSAIVDVFELRVRLATLMRHLLCALLATARSSLKSQRELALEKLALRQQLAILHRKTKRPKLTKADRAFWVARLRLWPERQNALVLVKPETVISWHRKGFKLYWTSESRNRGGRLRIDVEIRTLIRRMSRENPTWGAPRIHGELLKLGFEVSEATVAELAHVSPQPHPGPRFHRLLRCARSHIPRPVRVHRPLDGRRTASSLHPAWSLRKGQDRTTNVGVRREGELRPPRGGRP